MPTRKTSTKGSAKRGAQDEPINIDKITPDEAEYLAECVTFHFLDDSDEIANFLALIHGLTYTEKVSERETINYQIVAAFTPYLLSFDPVVKTAIRAAREGVRRNSK
jgi:hypothetical protein